MAVGGLDCSGGAGITVDYETIHDMGAYALTIATAVTAQNNSGVISINPVDDQVFCDQVRAVDHLKPAVIKTGLLTRCYQIDVLSDYIKRNDGVQLIIDPVMMSGSGWSLVGEAVVDHMMNELAPLAYLITPNLDEAKKMLTRLKKGEPEQMDTQKINNDHLFESTIELGRHLKKHFSSTNILLKGGHGDHFQALDIFFDKTRIIGFNGAVFNKNPRGTGCRLASAIAAKMARNQALTEAITIAKWHIHHLFSTAETIVDGRHRMRDERRENDKDPLPEIINFSACRPIICDRGFREMDRHIGFYPIVDSHIWVKRLAAWGVKTIQLRMKDMTMDVIEAEIKRSVDIARENGVALFINDYWRLAIKYQAYGVHLGQEDLELADLVQISSAGLRLGISTHNYYELARALSLKPSYVALGPVFATTTKNMPYGIQGVARLVEWKQLCQQLPLVAIGGINETNMERVWQSGVDGVAVISLVTKASNPCRVVQYAISCDPEVAIDDA